MGDGGWNLSSKTICAEPTCGKPIKRGQSYSCPAPDYLPRHFRCAYPEMAVTAGDEEEASS